MSNLKLVEFPHTATEYSSEKTTDCNNDLVLQGITNLQKDLGEVKGDIKVINNRLDVLDKTVSKSSDVINTLSTKVYLIYAGVAVLAFVIPYITNLLKQ